VGHGADSFVKIPGRFPRRTRTATNIIAGASTRKVTMKLLLADEKPAFRKFIRQILEMERDLEVVGEAADGEDVIWLTQQLKPTW